MQPGRDAAQRHHGEPVAVVAGAGLDGMTAHPLVAMPVPPMDYGDKLPPSPQYIFTPPLTITPSLEKWRLDHPHDTPP